MPTESAELSLLSIISLLSFFIFLIVSKFSANIKNGIFLDGDFEKPQAFHSEAIPRSGGLAGLVSLILFFILYFILFEKLLLDYIFLSFGIFSLGFLEDIKLKISPLYRLVLMITILILFIFFFTINISGVDLPFLNMWMRNPLFNGVFILLCFLFIINGANLVDGFNGLLTIHLLIINSVLMFLNFESGNSNLGWIITAQIVVLFCFLVFNFPRAKMFMGDGGSYLFGSLLAYNIIETTNQIPNLSSFFFCILLFYLFFEVFFSFFRKIYLKKSPLKPDNKHLHMLLFTFLEKPKRFKDCNYLNSLVINSAYLFLIIPGIFFRNDGSVCRYLFFFLLLLYLIFYFFLNKYDKKNNF